MGIRWLPILIAALLSPAGAQSASPPGESGYVVVWRLVRNDFYKDSFPSDQFSRILESSPPREVTVKQGETVSSILRDNFNISQTWTPAVYGAVVKNIVATNAVADIDKVAARTHLVIPELPTTGKRTTNNRAPNVSPALALGIPAKNYLWSPGERVFSGALGPKSPTVAAPKVELQYFRMPASEAKLRLAQLASEPGAAIAFGQSGRVMTVLADTSAKSTLADKVLRPEQASKIQDALSAAKNDSPRPIVIILDDSIPTMPTSRWQSALSSTCRKRFELNTGWAILHILEALTKWRTLCQPSIPRCYTRINELTPPSSITLWMNSPRLMLESAFLWSTCRLR